MKPQNYITLLFTALLISGILIVTGCSSNMDYETMVKDQLDSGVQNDSLFLGYHFGMGREEFRDYSWKLNQDGILTGFVDINYQVDFLKSKATMTFYPEFQDDQIVRVPVSIGYDAWAPWNEQFWPEALIEDLKEYYENEYGADFVLVYVPEIEDQAFVSIDGNREIRIYKNGESTAMVDFIDLNSVETVSIEESE